MAIVRIDNISPDRYRWAFMRAGYSEEKAIEAFPLLQGWLSADKLPTKNQLQDFARKFHVPFGYLFLNQPPHESLPFPVFRGTAGQANHLDLNFFDTVNAISARQNWLEEYFADNDITTSPLVGCITLNTPIAEAVEKLRNALNLPPRWAFSYSAADTAIGVLTQRLEDAGIFVAYNGVVANNTHRKLAVSECRGFALVSKVAPYIFINSDDSKSAQLFTLIHETAHVMLDVSAGHAGTEMEYNDVNERYCDMLAAEFLVPASELRTLWNKIGFVSPERRYEAPGCCTAAAKVIIIMGKDAGFSWFPNRSVAINSRENRVKPLSNIYKQRHHNLKTCHK